VEERINRHFGVQRPTRTEIGEFAADIPLTAGTPPKPPVERANP